MTEDQDNELEGRKTNYPGWTKGKKKNLQTKDMSDNRIVYIYVTEEPERGEKNAVQRKSFWRKCIWGKLCIFGEKHKHTNSKKLSK